MDEINVIIAGSGPAGLMAGISAAREGASVLILEQKDRAAGKLYATGNGRCNFANLVMEEGVYRGSDEFAMNATDTFDINDLIGFFNDLGLLTKHIGNYIYPYNEQASAVVLALLVECERLGVRIHTGEKVVDITQVHGKDIPIGSGTVDIRYSVVTDRAKYHAASVIIAPGGKASPSHGSDGNLNRIIRRLGHEIIPQEPALVPLTFSDRSLSSLAGVRLKCRVSLGMEGYPGDGQSQTGEVIFNKDNISGIPVMQLSRYAVCAMVRGARPVLILDILPEYTCEESYEIVRLAFRTWDDRKRSAGDALSLITNKTLADYIIQSLTEKEAFGREYAHAFGKETGRILKAGMVSDEGIGKITDILKSFKVCISGNAGFSRAQATAGGVSTRQINPDTMESLVCPGLYFAGEIIDVDGTCGGYNLHFAFASGRIAGLSCMNF